MFVAILFTADVLHDDHLKFSGVSLMLSAAGTKVRVEGAALSDGQDRNKPSKIIKVFAEKTKTTSEFDDTAKLCAMMRVFHQVQVIFYIPWCFRDVSEFPQEICPLSPLAGSSGEWYLAAAETESESFTSR